MVKLSVVSPTYNRSELLVKCYRSLCNQTKKDFEWIIVDDGSTDDTLRVAKSFSAPFEITVVSKPNGGKHTALNESHPYIHGEYVLILDSDDTLVPSAVEQVLATWEKYKSNGKIGVVTFMRGLSESQPFCKAETERIPVSLNRCERQVFYSTDCCEVIRSNVFRSYPFPEFKGENFIAEGALWTRVGYKYRFVYINKVIYICEYLEGGLTKSGRSLRIHNPNGGMYTSNLLIDKTYPLKIRLKNAVLYTVYGFFAKQSLKEMIKGCKSKSLILAALPVSRLLFWYWKFKYDKRKTN